MKALVLISVIFMIGCPAAAKHANAKEPDMDLLYRAKCTACHRLYPPREHTYQALQARVTRYGKSISDEERRRLLDYLKENAKQGHELNG